MRTATHIIRAVEKLIKKYDTRDPYELCKLLGIKIHYYDLQKKLKGFFYVSAKYCYAAHESRLHQNDRCKRFALCLVLTVRFRSLAPWGKLFQLFI